MVEYQIFLVASSQNFEDCVEIDPAKKRITRSREDYRFYCDDS